MLETVRSSFISATGAVTKLCSQKTHQYSKLHHFTPLRMYRGADKSLARPGRKQATATEDSDFHISYL